MDALMILMNFLTDALGPDYNVIFYNLGEDAIGTCIETDAVSRTAAQFSRPLPEKIGEMVASGALKPNTYCPALTTIYDGEKVANTGLLYVKQPEMGIDGILAINFRENKYFEIAQELLYMSNLDTKLSMPFSLLHNLKNRDDCIEISTVEKPETPTVAEHAAERIDEAILNVMGKDAQSPEKFNPKVRRAIMAELVSADVFTVKGMITLAAEKLYCSEVSIYRYIANLKK